MNWILMALAAGGAVAAQAAVNSRLGRGLGHPAMATFVSFAVGALCMLLYCLVTRQAIPSAQTLQRVPVWAWFGGVLGTFIVISIITTTPKLGVGAMIALVIAGQMVMAVILDHYGLLGLAPHPMSAARLAGTILLIAGAVLLKCF